MSDLSYVHAGISNQLLLAAHDLSTVEQRIILCTLSRSRAKNVIKSDEYYEIDLELYKKFCDVDSTCFYTNIRTGLKSIRQKTFTIKDGIDIKVGCWITNTWFEGKTGKIYLMFNKEIIPYISELKENFTRIYAKDALPLISKYTYRLYTLIETRRFKGLKGKYTIETLELIDMWQVPESKKEFKFFKRDILEAAVKEFNAQKLGILTVNYIKNGRKVEKIEFNYILERRNAVSVVSTVEESSVDTEDKDAKIDLNF